MIDYLVAERYAMALFQDAQETNCIAEVRTRLRAFLEAMGKSPDMTVFLKNPFFSKETRLAFLEKNIFDRKEAVSRLLINFISILFKKNRFDSIYDIEKSYKAIAEKYAKIQEVEIRTAVPLNDLLERSIVQELQKMSGMSILANKITDPKIIGGVVIKMGHKVLDGSVRFKINQMTTRLKEASV